MSDTARLQIKWLIQRQRQIGDAYKKRIAISLARARKKDEVMNNFMHKCFAVAVATVQADIFPQYIYLAIRFIQKDTGYAERGGLVVCCVYGVLITVSSTVIIHILTLVSGRYPETDSYHKSFRFDTIRLVLGVLPMCIAWAWKDVLDRFLHDVSSLWMREYFWKKVVISLSCATCVTLAFALYNLIPSVASARMCPQPNLLKRFVLVPTEQSLMLGFAWNQVVRSIIFRVRDAVPEFPPVVFFMTYYLATATVITRINAMWIDRRPDDPAKGAQLSNQGCRMHVEVVKEQGVKLERAAVSLWVQSLSFVYAWALSDTLRFVFFNTICECEYASCGLQANAMFTASVTATFGYFISLFTLTDGITVYGRASRDLHILGFSLTVGWAWTGMLRAFLSRISADAASKHVLHPILVLAAWLGACNFTHTFMEQRRKVLRQTQRDLEAEYFLCDMPDFIMAQSTVVPNCEAKASEQ
mmetsp:Transcript_76063/g.211424  ORF Transcript_76063/g.211424 Transcript_76063/m.211424 type:complete len:472 (-) Transcript_76063:143-1558(-)|eukprot:CAMPEP_0117496242 /NCGR_PEP_ID=MMETSP0784-20121206/20552_1 /TAXON_ID=39447 /ORGANISM="" /LENGTH=471 /DNA_ID=CAMNT_0005291199 /DNA_START=111 /DNA_END=1526 /DNA_ORIENTATION=+